MKLNKRNIIFGAILVGGFILEGCSSLNNYKTVNLIKPAAIQNTVAQEPKSDLEANDALISGLKLPAKVENPNLSNFYSFKGIYLDNSISLDENKNFVSERKYSSNEGQLSYALTNEHLMESLGLEDLLIFNRINLFRNSFLNAGFHFQYTRISDIINRNYTSRETHWFNPLESASFGLTIRF